MEEKSAPVEQITAPVEATPAPTKKDPKKVAAGKALARKNKEAKEAKLKLDGRQQVEVQSQPYSPFDTFRNASMLVGSALVLYHGYQAINGLLPKGASPEGAPPPSPPPTEDVKNLKVPRKENSIQME